MDINGKTVPFLVDTGATVSSVRSEDMDLPLSGKEILTVGISGVPHQTPLSAPAIITSAIHPFTTKHSLLLTSGSPVNLLGRDLLCKMNCKIHCTPKGIFLEVPHEHQFDVHLMLQQAHCETEFLWKIITSSVQLHLYPQHWR